MTIVSFCESLYTLTLKSIVKEGGAIPTYMVFTASGEYHICHVQ